MKISQSVLLGFLLILVLFATTTLVNFQLYSVVNENAEFVSRSTVVARASSRFQRNLLTMVNGLRGYLLTGEKSFIESYDTSNAENDSLLSQLKPLLSDSSQNAALNEIIMLKNRWTDEYTEPLREAKMLSHISAGRLDSFKKVYSEKYANGAERAIHQQLQLEFKNFMNTEYSSREQRSAVLEAAVRSSRVLSIALTVVSILVAMIVVAWLVRKISSRIAVLSSMANSIAAGDYEVHLSDVGNDELSSLGSALNHMADELSKNIALLKRRNEELDEFAHVVSHDLKGPIRGISNVVSWIEEDHSHELSPRLVEYVELIKGRLTRAEHLISGLLAYARADREGAEKEIVNVGQLIEEVLDNLPQDGDTQVDVGEMPVIHAERLLLFQIFSNLIGNAFKHANKKNGVIRVYVLEQPEHFEFFVEDNGIGIDEKYHARIFQIFQTLKERDSFESTGVGLAIVRKILDSKKQRITLRSSAGSGATFSFTWPKE